MADTKITALTAISTVDPATDVFPIVDTSDTTMAASGTTKKITSNQILGAGGTATLASATITGDLTVRTNKLAVTSTGVGCGTATPGTSLEVWKDLIRVTSDVTSGNYGMQFWRSGSERGRYSFDFSASLLELQADGEIRFLTAGENERLRIDSSGNLGLGVTPSAWSSGANLEINGNTGNLAFRTAGTIACNWYYNAGDKYIANGYATQYQQYQGKHTWYTAASGTAGNAITFTQAMTLDASGRLLLGSTSTYGRFTPTVGSGLQSANTTNVGIALFDQDFTSSGNIFSRISFVNASGITNAAIDRIGNPYVNNTGSLAFYTYGSSLAESVRIKSTGQVRFVPLAADPTGAEAGDVYYNSTSNKLKCYNGSTWNDLF